MMVAKLKSSLLQSAMEPNKYTMKKMTTVFYASFLGLILTVSSCKKDEPSETAITPSAVPEFFGNAAQTKPEFVLIANASSRLNQPQDLDFHPHRPNELWIINKETANTGGSTVMLTETGTPNQKFDFRRDGNAWHFMALPSAIAFSDNGNWATTANILDANHSGGTFTGPTLWSSDLNIYAKDHGPGTNGSHLDMLHASPYSMGIAAQFDNVFYVFDGYHGNIARYNFAADHGPGMHYHGDGKVHRFTEVRVKRDADVPSHLILDASNEWLYIVDGGNQRVLRMNIKTGTKARNLPLLNEELEEYWEMKDVVWEEFIPASFGLKRPCGIAINGNRLFVSDYETGEIICFNTQTKSEIARINTGAKGIMGIVLNKDNSIFYTNALTNQVMKIKPSN
jgi:DNA-binding beta-propeller fold protein YncE